jgi:hypothetical protein
LSLTGVPGRRFFAVMKGNTAQMPSTWNMGPDYLLHKVGVGTTGARLPLGTNQ